jgi:hypothetical protein
MLLISVALLPKKHMNPTPSAIESIGDQRESIPAVLIAETTAIIIGTASVKSIILVFDKA